MRKVLVLILLTLAINNGYTQTAGDLSVSTNTSQTSSPDYAPKNVIAIWIEDSNSKFVASLLVYAKVRIYDLGVWAAASNNNTVNATTGATQLKHVTRTCKWNGKDANNILVADGNYTLKMELSDNSNMVSNVASFPFVKGSSSQSQTNLSQNGFSEVSIVWTPTTGNSVSNVEFSNKYTLYPNPTKSNVYVNGFDIKSMDLISVTGQLLLTTVDKNINLSAFPNGTYFLSITTYSGNVVVKRIIKE